MSGDSIAIGRLGAPKGVRGDLKVHSYSGESAHFRKIKVAELRGADPATGAPRVLKLKVARFEGSGGDLRIAFEGYPSPEAARALTGMDIIVPRSEGAPLGPNEWYVDDLVGLSLVDASGAAARGAVLAKVRSVLEGGPEPWLEAVRIPGQKESRPELGSSEGAPERGSVRTAKRNPEGISKRNPEGISLVPFRKEFVGEVDLEAGTIELLAPWLLDE